ncbi:MAG: hypothetical protein ACETWE_05755 [Candidatus Bathyarchaeia archaeon]
MLKYEPDYFDKRGFKPPKRKEGKAINVVDLDEQIQQLVREKRPRKSEEASMLTSPS